MADATAEAISPDGMVLRQHHDVPPRSGARDDRDRMTVQRYASVADVRSCRELRDGTDGRALVSGRTGARE